MRYFSTFSGIGGFELGIQNACNKLSDATSRPSESDKDMRQVRQRQTVSALPRDDSGVRTVDEVGGSILSTDDGWLRPVCVGYSEIDKYAIKVYERNFNGNTRPDLRNGTEAIQNNSTNSTERKDRSISHGRNYGDITKINADELPDFDCLVGGFPCQAFSIAGKRKGFDDTRGTLFFDLARILRAKQPRLFVFENVKGLLSHDNGNTFRTIISTIDELGYDIQWQVLNSKNHGVPQNRERVIIVGHLRGTPRPQVFPIGETNGDNPKQNEKLSEPISNTLMTNYSNGKSNETYIGEGKDIRIRRLTPVECERLQGFPDNWTALGIGDEPISDSQRYKMCGNAVTTNVIQDVFERILS